MKKMASLQKKNLSSPDETRTFDKGKIEVVNVGDFKFGRSTFQPGWKWSTSVKPIVKTSSCQVHHVGYVMSGRLETVMDDGKKITFGPGDAFDIPPGHDGWVVGNEPVVFLDFMGAAEYAKKK
jgi:mannose-6-phosphate isomerase-like protein (cupin superfamily)